MVRRLATLSVMIGGGVGLLLASAPPASAAAACVFAGTANFTNPLKLAPAPTSYTFSGNLTQCRGQGLPATATISATGSGSAGCQGNTTAGGATLSWANGLKSTVSFTTSGRLNAVLVVGRITSGYQAGQSVRAEIAFTQTTPLPNACLTTGITTAKFNGVSSLGV